MLRVPARLRIDGCLPHLQNGTRGSGHQVVAEIVYIGITHNAILLINTSPARARSMRDRVILHRTIGICTLRVIQIHTAAAFASIVGLKYRRLDTTLKGGTDTRRKKTLHQICATAIQRGSVVDELNACQCNGTKNGVNPATKSRRR